MVTEKFYSSRTGTDEGGESIISRLLVQLVQMSGKSIYQERVCAVWARRERDTPLLIVCVYGHSHNISEARQLPHDLFLELARKGEDYVAIGDRNRTDEENPVATFIANGMVRYGDEPLIYNLKPSSPT